MNQSVFIQFINTLKTMSYESDFREALSCPNCNKLIAMQNYPTHQAYCSRFIRFCQACQQLVDIHDGGFFTHQCHSHEQAAHDTHQMCSEMVQEQSANTQMTICRCCGEELPVSLCGMADDRRRDQDGNSTSTAFQDAAAEFEPIFSQNIRRKPTLQNQGSTEDSFNEHPRKRRRFIKK